MSFQGYFRGMDATWWWRGIGGEDFIYRVLWVLCEGCALRHNSAELGSRNDSVAWLFSFQFW